MKVWIVWLPNVWKSTLFNALTRSFSADSANFPFCTIEPNIWIVNVNDDRLEILKDAVNWQKTIPTTCEFIDIAGIVKWASKWEWLWNKFLANIREATAILQVVRVFEDSEINHVDWKVDPKTDVETINSELILADLETLESKMKSIEKKSKMDKKLAELYGIYQKLKDNLEAWNLAINTELTKEEKLEIKHLNLLTNKVFIYAANSSEDQIENDDDFFRTKLWLEETDATIIPICAKLEAEMIDFSQEERQEFLADMWIKSTWMDELIKRAYESLWLEYYFTAWEKEVRAWTIKKWSTAPVAAWAIHTDFERWFIKADVVNWKDLVESKWRTKARESWKVKLQGKDYIVQDWDVILFKFNV